MAMLAAEKSRMEEAYLNDKKLVREQVGIQYYNVYVCFSYLLIFVYFLEREDNKRSARAIAKLC